MSSVRRNLGRSRRARWLGVALTITAIGVAACGGDDSDAAGTTAVPSIESDSTAGSGAGGEPILIKKRVTIQIPYHARGFTGDVLRGSLIGDSPFCPDGRFRDQHWNDAIGLVDRTFVCPDGSLRIGFTQGFPQGRTQNGPWKVLSGTGAFEELQGNGQKEVKYERSSHSRRGLPQTLGSRFRPASALQPEVRWWRRSRSDRRMVRIRAHIRAQEPP